jgi:hypothetical protein
MLALGVPIDSPAVEPWITTVYVSYTRDWCAVPLLAWYFLAKIMFDLVDFRE